MGTTEKMKSGGGKQAAGPRNWSEVSDRLGELGEIERQIRSLRDQYDQNTAVLKQQWVEASEPILRRKERLEQQIECFYWAHRDEVLAAGRKSKHLPFGKLGTRRSRSVVLDDPAAAQQWLVSNGFDRYLRTRTELDRESIRTMLLGGSPANGFEAVELLCCPGIHLRDAEEFFYEVDLARPIEPPGTEVSKPQRGARSSAKQTQPLIAGEEIAARVGHHPISAAPQPVETLAQPVELF